MTAAGSLKLDKAVVHGVKVGYPISADFDIADNLNSDVIQIRKCALKLGSTPLPVNGTINTRPNPSVVDVNLSASECFHSGCGATGLGLRRGIQPECHDRREDDRERSRAGADRPDGLQRQHQRPQSGDDGQADSAGGAACPRSI